MNINNKELIDSIRSNLNDIIANNDNMKQLIKNTYDIVGKCVKMVVNQSTIIYCNVISYDVIHNITPELDSIDYSLNIYGNYITIGESGFYINPASYVAFNINESNVINVLDEEEFCDEVLTVSSKVIKGFLESAISN